MAAPLPSIIAVLQLLTRYQKKGRTYILFRTWLTVALVTLYSSESLDVVTNSCSGAGTGSIHLFSYDPTKSYDVRRQIPTVSVLFGCYKMP